MKSQKAIQDMNLGADPNQKYWDLCLEYFNSGNDATYAIQTLWSKMPPPASLSLLATIVGAIYADTYWTGTKLDNNALAANLQAALGLNPPDCQKAANTAFSKWYGLVVRANMGDYGSIPRTGSLTSSPDVVVNGAATLTVQQLITMWNQYIYTPQPGLKNNTYGRAQSLNIKVPITKPVLRMYYSDAGFNPPPTSWVKMFTFDGADTSPLQGMVEGPIGVGDRAANPDAFAFTPPGSGHYCIVTVAGTEFFTNNPSTGGNWNTQEWIQYNGAAGWHNVDVPKGNSAMLKFHNQDGSPEKFVFEIECRNMPVGSVVSMECQNTDLEYPIKSHPLITSKSYHVVRTEAELPPNFAGELEVKFETPDGKPLPAGSSVDVRMNWHIPHDHSHYLQAIDQLRDTRSHSLRSPVLIPMGNFTFIGV